MKGIPDDDFFDDLSELAGGLDFGQKGYDLSWRPDLSPRQQMVFDCKAAEILVYGEKYSGKTYVSGGHKLVHHCVDEFNALAVVIVGSRGQAKQGGVWDKLFTMILPEWQRNMGLQYTQSKNNDQNHPEFWIRNRHGGWSKVVLVSLQHGDQIKSRMRGYEPSYVFVDEVTLLPDDVFVWVNMQIGRDPNIKHPQWIGATNPEGPSHWAFKTFWVECGFEDQYQSRPKDASRQVFHIPYSDNEKNADPRYIERVKASVKYDKVEYDRMVHGIWVDRPTGAAIFRDYYDPERHLKPPASGSSKFLVPNPNFPIIIGYDPGQVYTAIALMQRLEAKDRHLWLVFDELILLKERVHYRKVVLDLFRKIYQWNNFWKQRNSGFSGFHCIHISDDSAINQFRPTTGSYDALEFEKHSRLLIAETDIFSGLQPIKMQPAPKYGNSKQDRVRIMWKLLTEDRIVISRLCEKLAEGMLKLESESRSMGGDYDPHAGLTPKRSQWIHGFDAMTYPMLKYEIAQTYSDTDASDRSLGIFRVGQ